nr:retrovirus-related Pol polyprotein from transposon TNT 1-94 [Tanacetum cinerariifolium]
AAKFIGDFKSLAKEADASLAKHKILELEIKRLLKVVVSQDIISVVQNASVVDSSDLQTELEHTKERFENCVIKKETEYAKLWNDWYKKCDECKYDKISYDKAYKDMQQKIERLQAQLGDLKGKCKYTSCVSDTQNQLSQKLENTNVELEFQVFNYARENAHLKVTYKNLFDSISVSRVQTETKIASLQNELQSNIYKNAKLKTQLFKKVFDQKDSTQDTSKNTKLAKQPIVEILPKIGETNALSKPVTSNSVSTPQEAKGVNNDKVIAPGMFRISLDKVSREAKHVPNTVSARVDNTKTRRPKPRSNTKNDRVPSASKSSRNKNKEAKVEEHHRNLLLSKNNKHISSACNNIKIDSQDEIVQQTFYTINLHEMASASPICLMARASSTKSWLWHQRLSHLNFDTINDLAKNDLVVGLPKFNYHKEHLCPSCEQGKSKRASHPPRPVPNSRQRLHLLHMDLCGPMRIASINGKRYILVVVDDYSRYTWVHFLRSKDEAPAMIITFLKRITVLL